MPEVTAMAEPPEKPALVAYRAGREAFIRHRSLTLLLTGVLILLVNLLRHEIASAVIGFGACALVAWLARNYDA
jgi:hypothetical protein